jgi:hypothetical protein
MSSGFSRERHRTVGTGRVDPFFKAVDHDALLLQFLVQSTRELAEHLDAIADLFDHLVLQCGEDTLVRKCGETRQELAKPYKALVVVLDLHHGAALLVRDLFLSSTTSTLTPTVSTSSTISTTASTTSAVAELTGLRFGAKEGAVLKLAERSASVTTISKRGGSHGRSKVLHRELLDQRKLGHVLLHNFSPDRELFGRVLGLFLLHFLLDTGLELVDILADQANILSDLLLPSNRFTWVLGAIDLGLWVLQVLVGTREGMR